MRLMKSKIAETWTINTDTWSGEDPEMIRQRMDDVLGVFASCIGLDILADRCVFIENRKSNIAKACPKRLSPELSTDYLEILDNVFNRPFQFYFQASHEFSHVIMKCYPYPDSKQLEWVSECFCEAASFYTLEQLEQAYSNNYSIKSGCKSYFDLVAASPREKMRMYNNLQSYYIANKRDFWDDPYGPIENKFRVRNDTIALWLYKEIVKNPSGWKSIEHFADFLIHTEKDDDIDTKTELYFRTWHNNCIDSNESAFVEGVAARLGFTV